MARPFPGRHLAVPRLLLVLPASQVVALLWLIWTRTPHVPWQDEWELVNFLELADRGWLELATFWSCSRASSSTP
jgi:hypothetical protein